MVYWIQRFCLWLNVRSALKEGDCDMIVSYFDDKRLIIPGHDRAKQLMADRFGNRYERMSGGYLLPDASWLAEYNALHHGGLPLASWI